MDVKKAHLFALILLMTAGCTTTGGTKSGYPGSILQVAAANRIVTSFEDGMIIETTEYSFDDWGRILKGETRDGNSRIIKQYTGSINEELLHVLEEKDQNNAIRTKTLTQYNETGQILWQELYNKEDERISRTEYSYNPEFMLQELSIYDGQGTPVSVMDYQYEKGLLVQKISKTAGGTPLDIFELKRDEEGKLLQEIRKDPRKDMKVLSTKNYLWEGPVLLQLESLNENGVVEDILRFERNNEQLVQKQILQDRRGRILEIKTFSFNPNKPRS